ncbi:hypothetical protein lerEdw1_017963 [Lerista edwardsae]|nr:hypothetical protein lerEdw1_017963 [Lerista edwardsae]
MLISLGCLETCLPLCLNAYEGESGQYPGNNMTKKKENNIESHCDRGPDCGCSASDQENGLAGSLLLLGFVVDLAVADMNESVSLNETRNPLPWIQTSNESASLELSSKFPIFIINPWDIMLCISGTIIACENAIVVAIIFYTPNLRTPMFVLIGSLATADLLAGVGLILNFVFQYLIQSETISLITVGFLVASFTASVSSLLAITVDRYLSLYNALTYYSEKTMQENLLLENPGQVDNKLASVTQNLGA